MQELRSDLLSGTGAKKHGCDVCRHVDSHGDIYNQIDWNLPEPVAANFELNRREFYDGKVELSSLPLFVSMDISYQCNFSCIMCELVKTPLEMPGERIGELLETLSEFLVHMHVSGGEPLLNGPFRGYLSSSQHFPSTLSITTNGHFLNNVLLNDLVRFPRINLHISIDSFDPDTMSYQRAGCDPHRVFNALSLALAMREQVNQKRPKSWYVCLQVVPTLLNAAGLPGYLRQAQELGVDEVQFCSLQGSFPDLSLTGLSVGDAIVLAKDIRDVIQSGLNFEVTGLVDVLQQIDRCAFRREVLNG